MSIDYIIATYGKLTEGRKLYAYSEATLQIHMSYLSKIFKKKQQYGMVNLIKTVTIVVPFVKEEELAPGYYNKQPWIEYFKNEFPDITLRYLDYDFQENKWASYDQWLYACLTSKESHCFTVEDDYIINSELVDFDMQLMAYYAEKFPDNIGYMPSWWLDMSAHGGRSYPGIANAFYSKKTMESIPNTRQSFYDCNNFDGPGALNKL